MSKIHIKCPGPQKEWSISTTSQRNHQPKTRTRTRTAISEGSWNYGREQRIGGYQESGIRVQGLRSADQGTAGKGRKNNPTFIYYLIRKRNSCIHLETINKRHQREYFCSTHTHTHTHTRESGRIARSHRYASRYRYTRQIVGKFEWLWPEGAGRRTQDATYAAKHNGKPS